MPQRKNPVAAGLITIAILAIMVGSVSGLEANEKTITPKAPAPQISKIKQVSVPGNSSNPVATTTTPTVATTSTPSPTIKAATPTAPTKTTNPTLATSPAPAPAPAPAPVTNPTPPPPPPPTYTYKNGTFSSVGSFAVPGSTQKIGVTITINDDSVSASSITPMATGNTSKNYETIFINNYQPYVIGKSVATLNLSKISSASLTPQGFNNAFSQIRNQALN